ncbi:DUF2877 domain-containing protein [Gehongia tenuis]|nr:DUF2877 domain-containing protein [Gehongia tenuis]
MNLDGAVAECVEAAEKMFRNGAEGCVHSVYRSVINLQLPGRLMALHPSEATKTPLSITLRGTLPKAVRGMPVRFTPRWLEIEDTIIFAGERQVWNPKLAGRLTRDTMDGIARAIERNLFAFMDKEGSDSGVLTAAFQKRIAAMEKAAGWREVLEQVPSLIGLGQGLTPSGDDFLVGMLWACRLTAAPFDELSNRVRELAGGTNDLSREFLLRSCEGEFGEKLHRLAREGNEAAVKSVAETGHSSGRDTLRGILMALRVAVNMEESL